MAPQPKPKGTNTKVYSCPYCNYTSVSQHNWAEHLRRHAGAKGYQCTECDANFIEKYELKRHVTRIHTSPLEKPFKCDQCGSAFKVKAYLNNHKKSHEVNPYICKICGESFPISSRLTLHELKHSGEKPETCPKCSKTFISRQSLRKHLYTHNSKPGSKVCTLCGKSISQGGYLRVHMKVHENGKPHKCSQCNKSFVRSFKWIAM